MLAVRLTETAQDKLAEREVHLAAHQAYLRSRKINLVQSGPLHDPGNEAGPFGALLIAEVEDIAELQRFSDDDPFVIHGIYSRVLILHWNRTIGQ
jgi:hypothetical protein